MREGIVLRIKKNLIRLMIAELGFNLGEFAKKIGVSRPWLSRKLSEGRASPNLVVKIAKGLEVDYRDIIEFEG